MFPKLQWRWGAEVAPGSAAWHSTGQKFSPQRYGCLPSLEAEFVHPVLYCWYHSHHRDLERRGEEDPSESAKKCLPFVAISCVPEQYKAIPLNQAKAKAYPLYMWESWATDTAPLPERGSRIREKHTWVMEIRILSSPRWLESQTSHLPCPLLDLFEMWHARLISWPLFPSYLGQTEGLHDFRDCAISKKCCSLSNWLFSVWSLSIAITIFLMLPC